MGKRSTRSVLRLGIVSQNDGPPSLENEPKTGLSLNKGMPIYDQMSGPVVRPGHGHTNNPGIFGLMVRVQALLRVRLSKNFLLPT